jgi:hypothetical protein
MVELLSFVGTFRQEVIAAVLGVSMPTLVKYYQKELNLAKPKTGVQLVDVGLRKALGVIDKSAEPSVKDADEKMLRFFLERKYGMIPAVKRHIHGHFDLTQLDEEELDALEEIHRKLDPVGTDIAARRFAGTTPLLGYSPREEEEDGGAEGGEEGEIG